MNIDNDYSQEYLSDLNEAIIDFQEGKFVILLDAKNRENEGDLVIASQFCTPEAVNFMTKHARGLICVPMVDKRLTKLKLEQMVPKNTESHGTAFTVSVDLKKGNTTGISAADRARTIRALINPRTKPEDLARPGHIFPLRAKKGGTLVRSGQTEGSIDLCKISGLYPSAAICEIMNEDGSMARLDDLIPFAKKFDLKIISVAQLITYRRNTETLIKKVDETNLSTEYGDFRAILYKDKVSGIMQLALVKGDVVGKNDVLVRVQNECVFGDVFSSLRCDCGTMIKKSMEMIADEGAGIIIYLRQGSEGGQLLDKVKAYNKINTVNDELDDDNIETDNEQNFYTIGIGSQILKELGISSFRLLTNNPKNYVGLDAFKLKISDFVPIEINKNDISESDFKQISSKKIKKIGHNIND